MDPGMVITEAAEVDKLLWGKVGKTDSFLAEPL